MRNGLAPSTHAFLLWVIATRFHRDPLSVSQADLTVLEAIELVSPIQSLRARACRLIGDVVMACDHVHYNHPEGEPDHAGLHPIA